MKEGGAEDRAGRLTVSAVIPAFNEEKTVGEVVGSALAYVDEVVVIDDGSTDDTATVAAEAGATVVRHEQNRGILASVVRGLKEARGEILVTLDADGQHDPADIPRLVEPIVDDRADLVLGRRPSFPHLSEKVITALTRLRVDCSDACTGFRAVRSGVAAGMRLHGSCLCGTFVLEAHRLGARVAEVPITVHERREGGRRIRTKHLKQILHVLYDLARP